MKKIAIVIIGILILAGGYYLWHNRNSLFFRGTLPEAGSSQPVNNMQDQSQSENNESNAQQGTEAGSDNNGSTIGQYDCDQKCENRKNTSTYDYCREICGFNEPSSPTEDSSQPQKNDCEALGSSYEKDVCYKRKAISEKSDAPCNNIQDKQLKESCLNRVIEELIP